jgi:hypothetical protein
MAEMYYVWYGGGNCNSWDMENKQYRILAEIKAIAFIDLLATC